LAVDLRGRHLLTLRDLTPEELHRLTETALHLKLERLRGQPHHLLAGKTLGMIFQKPSLRTRISFQVGMAQLGGQAVYLGPDDIKLGERETTEDVATVLSRFVDGIMARVFGHEIVAELAEHSRVPVINGLSQWVHPCQVLGDLLTVWEKKRRFKGLKLVFLGDFNNVARSLIFGGLKLGVSVYIACPSEILDQKPTDEYDDVIEWAMENGPRHGAVLTICNRPRDAVQDADVVYTDVWESMGEKGTKTKDLFRPFQLNEELFKLAKPDAVILHCLPAIYGEELTYEISRSPNSAIFDQAENRIHAQKAVLAMTMR
jgi:ornithine carbamoyltransferase